MQNPLKLSEESVRAIRYALATTFYFRFTDWRKLPGFSGINLVSCNRLIGLGADFTLNTGSFCIALELGHRWLLQVGGLYQKDTRELRDPLIYAHELYGPKVFLTFTVLGMFLRFIVEEDSLKIIFRWTALSKVHRAIFRRAVRPAHA